MQLNPNLSSPSLEDLSFWLKAVHSLCTSNPEANVQLVGQAVGAQSETGEHSLGFLSFEEFARSQHLELDQVRLQRVAKTLFRLSASLKPDSLDAMADFSGGERAHLSDPFEDMFLRDHCA